MREHLRSTAAIARLCLRADPIRVVFTTFITLLLRAMAPGSAVFLGRFTTAVVVAAQPGAVLAAAGVGGRGVRR